MPIKILLITQWFDPEPTFKGQVFARALQQRGFEVEVITGFPNYPGGKIYSGYKIKWLQKEIIDGVQITRVPLYPSHSSSAFGRIFNYLSFSFTALLYGLFGAKRPDIIYAYHPPLTTGITAAIIRFFRRVPVIYDIQDIWPDTLKATGMVHNEPILKIVDKACSWVYKRSDQIAVLSPGFKKLLIKRGVPKDKIHIIYDWCDELSLQSPTGTLPSEFPNKDMFRILFAGNMGKAQALSAVLEAARILQADYPKINFVFIGGGLELEILKKKSKSSALLNVTFLPAVPMNEVGNMLHEADSLLIHLRDDPLFSITIPSKTQAYMAVGKPLLMAVNGNATELVEEAQCGVIAKPEDSQSIANAAIRLFQLSEDELSKMGRNSKQYYFDNMSLHVGVSKFSELFRSMKT